MEMILGCHQLSFLGNYVIDICEDFNLILRVADIFCL